MPKSALALLGLAYCLIQIASEQGGTKPDGLVVCASARICSNTDDRCLKHGAAFGIVPRNQATEWVIRSTQFYPGLYNFQVKDETARTYLGIDGIDLTGQTCSNNMFTDDRQRADHNTQGFTIEPYLFSPRTWTSTVTAAAGVT